MKTLLAILLLSFTCLSISSASGPDSDFDGYCDSLENEWGSNPLDPSSTPYFYYSDTPAYYAVGKVIAPNQPQVPSGTTGFSVSPPLPAGLVLNASTGVITGTPATAGLGKELTISASHPGVSRLTIPFYIEVFVVPDIAVDAGSTVTDVFSLGEFTGDGNLSSWTGKDAGIVASGGVLTVTPNGNSPRIELAGEGDLTSGARNNVLEFRIRQPAAAQPIAVRWIDGEAYFAETRAVVIEGTALPSDGAFHVYRMDLSTLFRGPVSGLSLGFGVSGGSAIQIDYVRLGEPGLPPATDLQITDVRYDKALNRLELDCPSTPGEQFRLEGSPDLSAWSSIGTTLPAGAGSLTTFRVEGISTLPQRYFRVVRLLVP